MNGHLDLLLDAYLDGELTALQKKQAEAHLAHCPDCQGLLDRRRALSSLLQEFPQAGSLKPANQFAAEVGLQLKRRQAAPFRRQALSLGWSLIPLPLLFAWGFINAVMILGNLVRIIPGAEQVMQSQASLILAAPLLPEVTGKMLEMAGPFNLLDWNWLTGPIALLIISLMYLCWLAGWWVINSAANQNWSYFERSK